MGHKFSYVYNHKKYREYEKVEACINAGALKVRRDADWITYHVEVEGQKLGYAREWLDAKNRALQVRKKLGIGKYVRICCKANGEGPVLDAVRFIEMEDEPHVYDGPGVEGVDRFESYVRQNFPHARWAGDCVCKPDSDHRDCAAVDYFDSYANMDKMKAEALSNSGYYHTKYVILRDRIYFPGGSSHYYTGVYHSHIHFSCFGGRPGSAC